VLRTRCYKLGAMNLPDESSAMRKTVLNLGHYMGSLPLSPWLAARSIRSEDCVAYHFRRQSGHGVYTCPEKRKKPEGRGHFLAAS